MTQSRSRCGPRPLEITWRHVALLCAALAGSLGVARGASADLMVGSMGAPDPVGAGQTLTYTVTVANLGPSTAFSVVVTDLLPQGLTLLGTSGGPCAEDPSGVPTCSLGTILRAPPSSTRSR